MLATSMHTGLGKMLSIDSTTCIHTQAMPSAMLSIFNVFDDLIRNLENQMVCDVSYKAVFFFSLRYTVLLVKSYIYKFIII